MSKKSRLVQGNAAIAQGAFYAGARFYAGYPITPSSEIAEIASRELPRLGGVFMQMEDELASMGAIVGASLSGMKSFTATSGPKNRVGKIFIDYLRNARGASTVAAYSVRARPGLPVSVPVSREELKGLRGAQQWTVANLHQRLQALKDDPWVGYANRQKISKRCGTNWAPIHRNEWRPQSDPQISRKIAANPAKIAHFSR